MSCLCHCMCVWHVMFMSLYVCVTCHVYVTVCVCDMSCLCHCMCVWHVMFMSLYVCVRYVYIAIFVWNMVRSPDVCGRSCFKSLCLCEMWCLNHHVCACMPGGWAALKQWRHCWTRASLISCMSARKNVSAKTSVSFLFPSTNMLQAVCNHPMVCFGSRAALCAVALFSQPCVCHYFSRCQIDVFCHLYRFAFCHTVRCKYAVLFEG